MATLMVVDDERVVTRHLEQLLAGHGHQVLATAFTGRTAVEMAESLQPDLALMDIRMPGEIDGINAAVRLREKWKIPTVFITAYAKDGLIERAKAAQPYGYILKPFDDRQVRAVVELAVARQALEKALARREAILEAVGYASEVFLNGRSETDQVVAAVLARLGMAGAASRAYVFVRDSSTVPPQALLRWEWCEERTPSMNPDPQKGALIVTASDLPQWEQVLMAGQPVDSTAKAFSGRAGKLLDRFGTRSFVAVPVFCDGSFWGIMGFDDCVQDRTWEWAETHALWAAARILGAFVHRCRQEARLRESHDYLESRVAAATAELKAANQALEQEVKERKAACAATRESEERYRSLVENISEVIYALDEQGVITYVSPAARAILGYDPEDLVGRSFLDVMHAEDTQAAARRLERHPRETVSPADFRFVDSQGHVRWLHISSRPVFVDGRFGGVHGVATDITARRALQDQLIVSERLAATGQLAASIAHEINSPLQAIHVILDMMDRRHAEDPDIMRDVNLLKGAFFSIRDTVRNLLDLNRPESASLQAVDVNEVVESTLQLVRSFFRRENVGLDLSLCPEPLWIQGSFQKLSQVLLNLFNNAVEACTRDNRPQSSRAGTFVPHIRVSTARRGQWAVVCVADDGPGIDDEDLERIFDPFFTRKKAVGMGVGLSICHGIVTEHQGMITAENQAEKGALFTIHLPLGNGESGPAAS